MNKLREQVAEKLAETIFNLGDAPNSPCRRLQFMGGEYPDKEKSQGGLCKNALIGIIRDNIDLTIIRTAILDEVKVDISEYIAEEQGGDKFLLDKGYKPALENLVIKMGWSEEHHGNRIYVTLPCIDNLRVKP
jgi:hypothetical protein